AVERCCSRPDHHLKAPRHSDKGLLTGQSELLGPVLVIQNLWLVSGLFYSGLLPVLLHPGPTDIRLPGLHLWLRFLTWRWQFVGEHVRQDHSRLKRSHSRGTRVQRSGGCAGLPVLGLPPNWLRAKPHLAKSLCLREVAPYPTRCIRVRGAHCRPRKCSTLR